MAVLFSIEKNEKKINRLTLANLATSSNAFFPFQSTSSAL